MGKLIFGNMITLSMKGKVYSMKINRLFLKYTKIKKN